MTDRPALILERDQGVLTLINNDPPINRMTFAYMDEVEAAVEEAELGKARGEHIEWNMDRMRFLLSMIEMA
jgi:hypothetical protein